MASDQEKRAEVIRLIENSNDKKRANRAIEISGDKNVLINAETVQIFNGAPARANEIPHARKQWRTELAAVVIRRGGELNLTLDQVLALASWMAKREITSLDELSARELGKFYERMSLMKRPALEE